jgi:hypothetical protein
MAKKKTGYEGVCYVLKAEANGATYFKIGHTKSGLDERVGRIKRMCPIPLHIVAIKYGSADDEKRLHWKHEEHRLHGEWFKECDGINEFISQNTKEKFNQELNESIKQFII